MAKTGRPSSYTEELAEEICDLIAIGWSSRQISALDKMPSRDTIFRWIRTEDSFSDQYARARIAQAAFFAEEILDIADDSTNDWMDRKDKDGTVIDTVVNRDHITRDRLRVDTRKWLASKYAPKVFGDKQTHEHTGKDGDVLQIVIKDVAEASSDDGGDGND